jgi:hypothetical protein
MSGHASNGRGSGENSAVSGSHVIFPMEAEAFVQELTTFSISDIGSSKYDYYRGKKLVIITVKFPHIMHTCT